MTLRPFVDIRIGDFPITTIPPKYLRELTFTSSTSTTPSFDISLIDPTYYEIERMLLLAGNEALPTYMRFGYDFDTTHVARTWVQGYLRNYAPTITNKGMEIQANFMGVVADAVAIVSPMQLSGRISSVVEEIARRLNMNSDVEPTNDDENEGHVDYDNGPKQWSTGNLTPIRFIRKVLLPQARSKSSKGAYQLFVTNEEREGGVAPTLHFHTDEFSACPQRKGEPIQVTYFSGKQNQVLSFSPNFESNKLGAYGIGSTQTRSFDYNRSQVQKQVHNAMTSSTFNISGKSGTVPPLNPADPMSTRQSHLVVVDDAESSRIIKDRADARYSALHAFSRTGVINLVGLPEFVNFDAFQYLDVSVLIPFEGGWKEHWSSGRWISTEVTHSIQSSYTIEAQLRRSFDDVSTELLEVAGAAQLGTFIA